MKAVSSVCLVAATAILGALPLTAAGNARFRYVASVYVDAKGSALNLPEGVACDSNGQIVVGDTGNDRLLRFTYRDKVVSGGGAIKIPSCQRRPGYR